MARFNFSSDNCKNCYKCVRICSVKAIKVKNNKAEIAVVDSNSFGHIKPGTTDASVLQKIATTPGKTYKFEAKIKVTANNSLVPAGAYLLTKLIIQIKNTHILLNSHLNLQQKQNIVISA